jgi:hypothetical protein
VIGMSETTCVEFDSKQPKAETNVFAGLREAPQKAAPAEGDRRLLRTYFWCTQDM